MTFSHDGQALISTDKGGAIKYFTPHLTNVHGFQGHREACHGIAWSPNDDRFVTGGDDGLVKVWNYRAATEEAALAGESAHLGNLQLSVQAMGGTSVAWTGIRRKGSS